MTDQSSARRDHLFTMLPATVIDVAEQFRCYDDKTLAEVIANAEAELRDDDGGQRYRTVVEDIRVLAQNEVERRQCKGSQFDEGNS